MTIERTHYGDIFETAELTNTSMSIRMRPNKNMVLRAIRTALIFCDYSGSLTNLHCKLYSDRDSSPGALIATSLNSFTKAEIIDEKSGVREIYFEFDDISLQENTFYHFVLNASEYVGDAESHIAWKKAWPDPIYRTGLPLTFESLGVSPYPLTVIGAEL